MVLRDISLGFFYGAKIGVLGLNGSGKSTLLRIMAGVDKDYLGEVMLTKGYTVGLLEQEPQLDATKTVKQVVEEAVKPITDLLARYDEITNRFGDPLTPEEMDKLLEEQGRVQEEIGLRDAWTLDSRLEQAMNALRCPPGDTPIAMISGGERRRVALCRLLLTEPDILLLDEPTNHLDAELVAWLERHLQQYKGTVIAVTHDRYFLDNVAGWILELDRRYGIPWQGNYSTLAGTKAGTLATGRESQSKRIQTLQRELDWIHMAPRARQAKGKRVLHGLRAATQPGIRATPGRPGDLPAAGTATGRYRDRFAPGEQSLRRPAADRKPGLEHPAGEYCWGDRTEWSR